MTPARPLLAALLVLAFAACTTARSPERAAVADEATVLHVLRRATYGPRPGDVARVQAMGLDAWLERQLDPAAIEDTAVERSLGTLPTLTMSIADLNRDYPRLNAQRSEERRVGKEC